MHAVRRAVTLVFVLAVLWCLPRLACAASATVTATLQPDGGVVATATGSFAGCVVCDARDSAGNCTRSHIDSSGSVTLRRDGGAPLCSASGSGTATCTRLEDRSGLHGTHGYSATAADCTGSASSRVSLTLENTPTVSVTGPSGVVSGPVDITGTATFKPTLSPTKGTIALYINNIYTYVSKSCPTETCAFSYQELTRQLYSLPMGGPYTVKLVATGGGATASAEKAFRVGNCRDTDGDGFFGFDAVQCPLPLGEDCDDTDPAIYPRVAERCNGKDNNCNGVQAEGACDGLCVALNLPTAKAGGFREPSCDGVRGAFRPRHAACSWPH